jgi:adenosylhomocysteine nucleosidase
MNRLITILALIASCSFTCCTREIKFAVIVSANIEWKALKKVYPDENYQKSAYGEYFFRKVQDQNILFFQEGWGKVSAAGATQYVIDRYNPEIFFNLGTCGGFEGDINRFDIILANKTVIYDISEAMGDSKEAIADYTTDIDLSWLKDNYPVRVIKTVLVSADKDLRKDEIEQLKKEYYAIAGDWESGAIAYTARLNNKKILILRGVSDLVSTQQGEAYGNLDLFVQRTDSVMAELLTDLPKWIDFINNSLKTPLSNGNK